MLIDPYGLWMGSSRMTRVFRRPRKMTAEDRPKSLPCGNVGIAIIHHPPNHFYGWYNPSKMGGFWHCYTHIILFSGDRGNGATDETCHRLRFQLGCLVAGKPGKPMLYKCLALLRKGLWTVFVEMKWDNFDQ